MIYPDKQPLPEDDTPAEAPPTYYDAVEFTSTTPIPSGEKVGSNAHLLNLKSLSAAGKNALSPQSWFPFGQRARTAKQVKATVLVLLRDLVRQSDMTASAGAILESCTEACHSHGIPMSSLLQEQSVEGHTPMYWIIVKRDSATSPDLLDAFLALAAPLTERTISDIRLACLHNSDHSLYQQLRRSPTFSVLSGAEELLLGGPVPPDDVQVSDVAADDRAFIVCFHVPMFQKRLRVSKQINLEFIAKGRMWSLKFVIATADNVGSRPAAEQGSWLVNLTLLEHSPPTFIDSRLIISDASSPSDKPSVSLPRRDKGKQTIILRMMTRAVPLAANGRDDTIAASFKDSLMVESLQYQGSSYLAADGSLDAILEARLCKPGAECIIC